MIIRNIEDLAKDLDTTVSELKAHVHTYTDYDTVIEWSNAAVTLTTTETETGTKLTKILPFPFDSGDYDDAIIGLQCRADEIFCDYCNTGRRS